MPKAQPNLSVSEALRRRVTKTKFDEVAAPDEGINLSYEKGTYTPLSPRNYVKLIWNATTYYHRQCILTKGAKDNEDRGDRIKSLVRKHDGLRGLVSLPGKFRMSVYPQSSIEWKPDALKEALGDRYPSVVAEDVVATVTVPLGRETPAGPMNSELAKTALSLGFLALGFNQDELLGILSTNTKPRVDEAKLYEMVKADQVDVENAGVPTEKWTMKVLPLK